MKQQHITLLLSDREEGDKEDLRSHLLNKLDECGYEVEELEIEEVGGKQSIES